MHKEPLDLSRSEVEKLMQEWREWDGRENAIVARQYHDFAMVIAIGELTAAAGAAISAYEEDGEWPAELD